MRLPDGEPAAHRRSPPGAPPSVRARARRPRQRHSVSARGKRQKGAPRRPPRCEDSGEGQGRRAQHEAGRPPYQEGRRRKGKRARTLARCAFPRKRPRSAGPFASHARMTSGLRCGARTPRGCGVSQRRDGPVDWALVPNRRRHFRKLRIRRKRPLGAISKQECLQIRTSSPALAAGHRRPPSRFTRERSQVRNPPRPSSEVRAFAGTSSFPVPLRLCLEGVRKGAGAQWCPGGRDRQWWS